VKRKASCANGGGAHGVNVHHVVRDVVLEIDGRKFLGDKRRKEVLE